MTMAGAKVYKIEDDPVCGRQLIATRKILKGELIIDEPAVLTGPGFASSNDSAELIGNSRGTEKVLDFTQNDTLVCLVCCVNITPSASTRCCLCGLLLCSEMCQSHDQHAKNECIVFPKIRHVWVGKEGRSKKSLYNLVMVIRGLFYRFRDLTKWTQISKLCSKSDALVKVGAFEDVQDLFRSLSWNMFASLSCSHPVKNGNNVIDSVTDENIFEAAQHCLGVLRMNAFSSFSESYCREGLFFISSFMSHRCIINTDRQIGVRGTGDVRMVVRASVDIEKGEPITTTYLSLLYSTEERHRIMIKSWLFVCNCKRCGDPTECQAFSGTTICQGRLTADGNAVSCCDNVPECLCHVNKEKRTIIRNVRDARPLDLYNITKVESWLDAYDNGELLHPYHSLFAHVKLFLCQFYGRQSEGLDKLSVSQLKRKVNYCLQTISIFDRVCPGVQMCRGVVMFELWCGLRKLSELRELPLSPPTTIPESIQPLSNTSRLTEIDITTIKKRALDILQLAFPNSSEEAMANCLLQDEEDQSYFHSVNSK